MFNFKFVRSKECKDFRQAWGIPEDGFMNHTSYEAWANLLNEKTNIYRQSEKYVRDRRQVDEKHKEECEKKITRGAFEAFANHVWLRLPLVKYDFDLHQTTLKSGKPVYWEHFIEKCILMNDFEVMPVRRPKPESRVSWNNDTQAYELTIYNIFPDTTMQDFNDRWFKDRFKEQQAKLPGYKKIRSRRKQKFDYAFGVLQADDEMPSESDLVKTEYLEGENNSDDLGEVDRRRMNKLKQTRSRLKNM